MNSLRRLMVPFIALLTFCSPAFGQENNVDQFKYCIAVKQTFDSWGECSHGKPGFVEAEVELGFSNSSITTNIPKAELGDTIVFSEIFKGTSEFNKVTLSLNHKDKELKKIVVKTEATDIRNDTKLSYESSSVNWRVGVNEPLSQSASDPCSNNANWSGKREGYTMFTTVVIDDPVMIAEVSQETLNAEEDYLQLVFDNFYLAGEDHQVVLQMKANDGIHQWEDLEEFKIRPGRKAYISYPRMAGKKNDSQSNYYQWLNTIIQFRVKKTLLNGEITYGNTVGVRFASSGPKFRVKEVRRSACESTPIIEVELFDQNDGNVIDNGDFKWVLGLGEDQYIDCIGTNVNGNAYQLNPESTDPSQKSPFEVPGEWTIQLKISSKPDLEFHTATFVIPEKPDPVNVTQSDPVFPLSLDNPIYHLLSEDNPYALINIKDSVARLPYTINKTVGENAVFVASLDHLKTAYEDLSVQKRDSIRTSFNDSIASERENLNSNWGKYFNLKFQNWFFESQQPQRTDLDLVTAISGCQTTIPGYLYAMSENSRFLAFGSVSGIVVNSDFKLFSFIDSDGAKSIIDYHAHWKTYVKSRVTGDGEDYYSFLGEGTHSGSTYDGFGLSLYTNGICYTNWPDEAGSVQNVSNTGVYKILDYNGCGIIGEKSDGDFYLIETLGSDIGRTVELPLFESGILDSSGKRCAYTRQDGSMLYYFQDSGNIRFWSGTKINKIVYVSSNQPIDYIIYENADGDKLIQQILGDFNKDEKFNQIFGNVNHELNSKWYDQYYEGQWQKYLAQNFGYKLYNHTKINPDAKEKYTLIDSDGCSYDFLIEVKVPPQPVFVKTDSISPSSNCSSDGEIKLKCTTAELLPLTYESGTIESIDQEVTFSSLNWVDAIQFYNSGLDLNYDYLVSFKDPARGIQSVVKQNNTCGSEANGKIIINFASNSTSEKTYRLHDGNEQPIDSFITVNNSHTFRGLGGNKIFNVSVSADGCPIPWGSSLLINDEVFTISADESNATVIGGNGSAVITVTNLPLNVTWTGTAYTEGQHTNSFSLGKHIISASHEGCITKDSIEILEPGFTADLNIGKKGNYFVVSTSSFVPNNQVVNSSLTIEDEQGNIYADREIPASNSYSIVFNYDGKKISLYNFSETTFRALTTGHTVEVEEQKCPGDEVLVRIIPEDKDGEFKVNFDGRFLDELETTTSLPSLIYSIQTSERDTISISSSQLNVKKVLQTDTAIDVPQAQPVFGKVRFSAISCNGSSDGQISISHAQNGSGNYQWRRSNSDVWRDTIDVSDPLPAGEYEVYLRDSGNQCQQVRIGTVNIVEPPVFEVVAKDSIVPVCADGTGSVSLSVDGGNGFYKFQLLDEDRKVLEEYPAKEQLDEQPLEEVLFTADSTYAFPGLAPGSYRISAIDFNGCDVEAIFDLPKYENPAVGIVKVDSVRCYSEFNGAIELDSISGTSAIDRLFLSTVDGTRMDTLLWPNDRFEGLAAGFYNLYLKDENGCLSENIRREVLEPELLEIHEDTIVPVVYKGAGTGKILVEVSGGNNPAYMHARLLELASEEGEELRIVAEKEGRIKGFDGLKGGTYTMEVRDVKGCVASMSSMEVGEREDSLRLEQGVVTDALCNAGVGSLSVEAFGGWGGYTYWVVGKGGASKEPVFESFLAGTYLVMVEDSLGATDSIWVTINEPGLLNTRLLDAVLPTCEANGELTFKVSGGVGPYQMFNEDMVALAGNDSEAFTAPQLGVGDYRFTTVDANGCMADFTGSLGDDNLLDVSLVAERFVSAPGAENGRLRAVVKGGVSPYIYGWKNLFEPDVAHEADGGELVDVGSGYYEVTVTEGNGCEKSEALLLPDFDDRFMVVDTLGHERSLGASDGFVRLLAQQNRLDSAQVVRPDASIVRLYGEVHGIQDGVVILNNLAGGKYAVFAYGPAGREVVDFKVIAYGPFVFGRMAVSHVSKVGGNDGSTVVSVQGGAPDFTFEWEALVGDLSGASYGGLGNEGRVAGLTAGEYRVRVRDRYDNVIEREVQVDEPQSVLELVIADSANQPCFNTTDAWVSVEATGGWGNYHYRNSSEPEFLKSFRWDQLPAGEHKFFTMDQKGIVDSVSIIITEPDLLRANVALVDSVNCYGGGDGKIYFDVEGGTGPYRYALSEDTPIWRVTTSVLDTDAEESLYLLAENLAEEQYVYLFTDANDCLAADTLSVFVPQPDELLFGVTDVVHTTCDTDNGSIGVVMQGGSAPYRYEWTDNSGTVFSSKPFVDELKQGGYYRLKVWDKYNCSTGLEQTIHASTLPQILNVATSPVLCYGDRNGKAGVTSVTPAEPFAPYGFSWSNSAEGETAKDFASGRHWVAIRDTNGCETIKYFDVATPDTLGLSLMQLRDAHCFGYSDGRIEVRPFGGVGDYSISWSNGTTTTAAEGLSKGLYPFSFTDANNCLFEEIFEINEPPMEVVDLGDDFTMCPGNSMVIDGRNFAAHEWRKEEALLSAERYFTVTAEGEYALRVTNDRGCFAYDTIAVSIGNDALKADFLMSSDAILGDTILIFELSNLPLDSLSWVYPPEVFSNETPMDTDDYILHLKTLDHGMYNVALYAYSGGCFSQQVKQIEVRAGSDIVDEDDFVGYQDPLIKHFVVSPNPNDGRFNVNVELRESADIHLAVFSVSQGVKLEERRSSGMDAYAESFVLANVNTGVYVVVLSAGSERRQIKIVIE